MGLRYSIVGPRRLATVVLVGVSVLPAVAQAQQPPRDPTPLWREFPLAGPVSRQPPPRPTADPAEARRAEAESDAARVPYVVAAALVLLALAAGAMTGARRRRDEGDGAPVPPLLLVPAPATPPGTRVLGYISLSDGELQASVPSLTEQEATIRETCRVRGWELVGIGCDEPRALRAGTTRPGLDAALARIAAGDASCLVVSRLACLGRSAVELGALLEQLGEHGATLVALDHGIDTSTESGSLVTQVLSAVAAGERGKIAAGTREARSASRIKGPPGTWPAVSDLPVLRERILAMRASGMTLQAIADRLNQEGVATLRGGARWRPSSVQAATGYKRPPRRQPQGNGDRR